MKRIIKAVFFILLTFAIPYIVMYFKGAFTLKSYGSVMCYIGLLHVMVGLFCLSGRFAVGDRTSRGHIYSSNLYNDLANPQQYTRMRGGSLPAGILFSLLGAATIYAGYLLTLSK